MSDEVRPEIIEKTQKSLGKYVKKPALSEKLLKKPPFRFLHDVIMVVVNETGYLKGLFSETESVSSNFTDKESKVQFLNKLIDAVKATTKADLKVKATKIVAGLEAAETNLLLQAIAKAIDRKIDSKAYVESLKNKTGTEKDKEKVKKKTKIGESKVEKKTVDKGSKASSNKDKEKISTRRSSTNVVETPKSTDRTKSTSKEKKDRKEKENKPKASSKDAKDRKKEKIDAKKAKESIKEKEELKEEIKDDKVVIDTDQKELPKILSTEDEKKEEIKIDSPKIEQPNQKPIEPPEEPIRVRTSSAGLVRPKSARPKSATKEEKERTPTPKNPEPNLDAVEMSSNAPIIPQSRPKSSLRPPSVRPSSARPGAPRLRPDSALPMYEPITMGNINVIVETADAGNDDDEDVVVVHNTLEHIEEPQSSLEDLNIPLENKGHLVEQILEQIQEGGNGDVKKVDIDWEQDSNQNNSKDINQLRNLIQNLTKTANPLGKLLNYLHEDVEAMQNELHMWTNTKKQLYNEIDKQKRMSAESNKPLLAHLDKLTVEISQQEQEIANMRANILRNESRIKELLIK